MNSKSGIKAPSAKSSLPKSTRSSSTKSDADSMSRSSSISTLASVAEGREVLNTPEESVNFAIGEQVWVNGTKPGIVQYLGETQFAPGIWAGISLEESVGKNDGSVNGVKYFECEPQRGIFIRPHRLTRQAGSPPSLAGDSSQRRDRTPPHSLPYNKASATPGSCLSSPTRHVCSKLRPGERVIVSSNQGNKTGILRFLGTTEFAVGEWAGIELDLPVGKNDGSVSGKRYFTCKMKHGLFAPISKVSREGGAYGSQTPSLSSLRNRSFSRESLNSSTSSVTSSKAGRVKLGINSLGSNQKSPGAASTIAQTALQEALKEKEVHIERLLKERDLDREEIARITARAGEAEQKYCELHMKHEAFVQENEAQLVFLKEHCDKIEAEKKQISSLLDERNRKLEDLQFRLEEEIIASGDLKIQVEKDSKKIQELEEQMKENMKAQISEEQSLKVDALLKEKDANMVSVQSEMEKLHQELNSKDEQIAALLASVADAKSKSLLLESHSAKAADMENKLKELEGIVQSLSADRDNLMNEVSSLKERTKNYELKEKEKQAEIDTLKDVLQKKEVEVSKLAAEVEQSKVVAGHKNELEKELAELRNAKETATKDADEKIQQLTLKIASLSADLDQKDKMVSGDSNQISSLKQSMEEKNAELQKLKQDLTENAQKLETEMAQSASRCKMLEEQIVQLTKENSALQAAQAEKEQHFTAELEKLTQEREKLDSEMRSLAATVESRDKELANLKSELEDNKKEVVLLSQGNSDQISGLQKKISEMKDTIESMRNEADQAVKTANQEKELLSSQMKEKAVLLLEKEQVAESLKKELSEKEKLMSDLNTTLKVNESKLSELQNQLNEKEKLLQQQISEIQTTSHASITEKEESIKSLEAKLADLLSLVKEKEKDAVGKQKEVQELKSVIEQKEGQIIELGQLVEQSQVQLEQLKLQNNNNMSLLESRICEFKVQQEKHFMEKEKKLHEEIERLESELQKKTTEVESGSTQINSLTSRTKSLEDELQKLQLLLKEKEEEKGTKLAQETTQREKLEQQLQLIKSQCDKLVLENEEVKKQVKFAQDAKHELEKSKDNLVKEKLDQLALIKDREIKLELLQQEVDRMRRDFSQHKEELQQKLDVSQIELQAMKDFKTQLELQHEVLEELQQQLQDSENKCAKMTGQLQQQLNVSEEKNQLEVKVKQLEEIVSSLTTKLTGEEEVNQILRKQLDGNEVLLKMKNEELEKLKLATLANDVGEIDTLKSQMAKLKEENSTLSTEVLKMKQALSSGEKISGDLPDAAWIEEKESLLSQVNFLNSIIVDMQKKNEELKKQMESNDMEKDLNFNGVKAPRFFCDICDMFDLHDTEDCPKQCSLEEDEVHVPHSKHNGKRNEERPYCNNCEIFGHWTLDCDQEETF